jgi:hypothetical protein
MNRIIAFVLACVISLDSSAQTENIVPQPKKVKHEKFYFSWGYNSDWYTNSNIYVKQSSLGNDYKMNDIIGHDHKGWDAGLLTQALSIPQYNYRLGYFFNDEKGLAFEINFDHTKFLVQEPQNVHITGTLHGEKADTIVNFQQSNGFYYYLNNGANFLLFWATSKSGNVKVDVLAKAGIGPVTPHVENSFFGKENSPHFQLGGWNTGIEGTVKVTFYNRVFLEYCNKLDYARYSHLSIYEGEVHQAFGTYEMILNLGVVLNAKDKSENVK